MKIKHFVFTVALLLSIGLNGYLAYLVMDVSTSYTYRNHGCVDTETQLEQTRIIISKILKGETTKEEIVEAVNIKNGQPFSKEGYIWIPHIGLKFDENNHLVEVHHP